MLHPMQPIILARLEVLIREGALSRIFCAYLDIDSPVQLNWNAETPLGQIGALLDEAGYFKIHNWGAHDDDYRRRVAKSRRDAKRLLARARKIADGLSEEDRILATYIGDPTFKEFINLGIRPK